MPLTLPPADTSGAKDVSAQRLRRVRRSPDHSPAFAAVYCSHERWRGLELWSERLALLLLSIQRWSVSATARRTDDRLNSLHFSGLAPHCDLIGTHLGMSSQQTASAIPTVHHLEGIASNPRVEGVLVPPARDHHNLVCLFGAQNLHRDEPREVLYEPPMVREP